MPETGYANLTVYNAKGQLVKTLVDDIQPAGKNSIIWNGKNLSEIPVSSGIYLLKLRNDRSMATKKIMLIK